jgi:hypothetical protein
MRDATPNSTPCDPELILCSTDFSSVLDRINSLFGRLGKLPAVRQKNNGLAAAIRVENRRETESCQYFPVDEGNRRPMPVSQRRR